jgi:hypothetical protein
MALHLLGLPRELRDKIYKNILVADNDLIEVDPEIASQARSVQESDDDERNAKMMNLYPRLMDTQILAVNHRINAEAMEVFHSENTFSFSFDGGKYHPGSTARTKTMRRALKIKLWVWEMSSKKDFQNLVAQIKSCNQSLRSLWVSAFIPAYNWGNTFYYAGSECLQILDDLRDVRVKGSVEFILDVMCPYDDDSEADGEAECQFIEGFQNLGKVVSGVLRAEEFEWPGQAPQSSSSDEDEGFFDEGFLDENPIDDDNDENGD